MSVATQLGLSDPNQDLLAQARQQWPTWCRHYPGLAVVEDLLDLPPWLKEAEKSQADDVLHTLAKIGSPRGGDNVVAAGALAWLLLPGACLVAHRLRSLTNRIDEIVAAQLWLEVRGFPWERLHKVAVLPRRSPAGRSTTFASALAEKIQSGSGKTGRWRGGRVSRSRRPRRDGSTTGSCPTGTLSSRASRLTTTSMRDALPLPGANQPPDLTHVWGRKS